MTSPVFAVGAAAKVSIVQPSHLANWSLWVVWVTFSCLPPDPKCMIREVDAQVGLDRFDDLRDEGSVVRGVPATESRDVCL